MAVASLPTSPGHMAGGSRRASALQSFGIRKKSEIDIVLDGKDEFIRSYSTFDEIKGYVNLRFEKDTPIDSLNISFQGQANTWVEKMTAMSPRTGRATAKHVFLRMQQPIDGNPFSEDNIALAGTTYSVPFTFVVPEKVLPFVCNHSVENEGVKAQHHYLPPSIGEEMLAGEGSVLMDDLCPAMAKIVYSVKVNIVKSALNGRNREEIHNSVGIRIIPSRPEVQVEIPPTPREGCLKYSLRKEKNVRKGILKLGKKQGRLTAETSQPQSLRLPHQQEQNKEAVTTTATINFRYDPASLEEEPPQLTSVASRLKAYTFFGAGPFRHLPDPSNYDIWSIMHGQYALTVDLSTMNLSSVRWTKHDPEGPFAERLRHDSVATTTSSKKDYGRKMSTSTGTASTGLHGDDLILNRTQSDLSHLSSSSYSPASSTTTLSTPASPAMTSSNASFPDPTIVSPSTQYDQTLPYYTTSIIVPVTLPTVHTNNSPTAPIEGSPSRRSSSTGEHAIPSSGAHRGSAAAAKIPATTASVASTPFSRKRGIPTFLPTFHSCLVARSYVLELNVHATNPAPQMTLRTPIQITSDPSPHRPHGTSPVPNQFPLSWYDPFDQAALTTQGDLDAEETANDEAIARALGPNYAKNLIFDDDQIPSYADLQIQTTDNVSSYSHVDAGVSGGAQRRHNSTPLTSFVQTPDVSDKPPEYNAPVGFRRRQSTPLQTTASLSTVAEGSNTGPAECGRTQRRKGSSGWTKKLGLRT